MTVAHPASLSIEFPRQECWSGLPFPSPGDLLYPVIKPMSPAFAGRLFSGYQGNPVRWNRRDKMLPVKVESKYRDFFFFFRNRRKQIEKVLKEKKSSTASYASHTTYPISVVF